MEMIKETINNIGFNLLPITGGSFFMGNEDVLALHNVHKVEISDFYMAEIPVTVSLFYQFAKEVIENEQEEKSGSYQWLKEGFRLTEGINWRHDEKGELRTHFDSNQPIVNVSWYEAEAFCRWLANKTGKPYRLPTEAEWEYVAMRGLSDTELPSMARGVMTPEVLDEIAWYRGNSGYELHPAGQKKPNKFGLYDILGNVWEWCNDWFGLTYYPYSAPENPLGRPDGVERSYRGGGFDTSAGFTCPTYRGHDLPEKRFNFMGFRLALDADEKKPKAHYHPAFISICSGCGKENFFSNESCIECNSANLKPLKNKNPLTLEQTEVLAIDMVAVEGGSFIMGTNTRKPLHKGRHKVTLDAFYIGRTAVTQALWNQVMDFNPSHKKGDDLPVTDISWFDAQAFTKKLSYLTGKQYRLPTEAEWEFAARGGNLSRNYKYSGSNRLREVAWYHTKSNDWNVKPVAKLKPNELGLYDMSGNVEEWCQDWYGEFTAEAMLNPNGPETGTERIVRGGWANSDAEYCELSLRANKEPLWYRGLYGFRLAMSTEGED